MHKWQKVLAKEVRPASITISLLTIQHDGCKWPMMVIIIHSHLIKKEHGARNIIWSGINCLDLTFSLNRFTIKRSNIISPNKMHSACHWIAEEHIQKMIGSSGRRQWP